MEFDREALLRQFREEVEDLLLEMERCALLLDEVDSDLAPVEELFRCAHTLKGSASCVGHGRLTALAHEVEGLFEAVTTRRRAPDAELTALSLAAVDALGRCGRGKRSLKDVASCPRAGTGRGVREALAARRGRTAR